jgi:UDP-2,3-diacylglucosamine pyrophosphatase LpxH
MRCRPNSIVLFAVLMLVAAAAAAQPQPRPVVVVSDFHMGLGKRADGTWDPREDFRWTGALRGFLDELSRRYQDRTDLVIAGDFLELWQLPADIKCLGDGADLGCTVAEMTEVARRVAAAHKEDLALLAAFSRRGDNRVHVIPGNHDSALVVAAVWAVVGAAMDAASGRVLLVGSGVWSSADGRIVIEHGHQIGSDVNRYRQWPVVTASRDGREYIVRPWGELFVQRLFNAEENEYPIIDNLSPETAGARYRMADRGLWRSAADVARFISFNVFETSARQKGASLGRKPDAAAPCTRAEALAAGYKLVLGTLQTDDPFRVEAESNTAAAAELRKELDAYVRTLPDEDLQHLCARQVDATALGAAVESAFTPRIEVIRKHLGERLASFPDARVFVYGHTHQLEEAWTSLVNKDRAVTVANPGAFQRLVDEAGFLARVTERKLRPQDGLRLSVDALAPCYGVVLIERKGGEPAVETMLWHMPEGGTGRFVSPGARACE